MSIFVINAYEERTQKYDERYTLFPATLAKNVTDEDMHNYAFIHSTKDKLKRNICACSLSHKRLLKKIIDDKLNKVIVIEDDAVIDFSRIDELNNCIDFTFIGGEINPPKFTKEFTNFNKHNIKHINGLNKIKPEEFIILGTHGYYIPTYEVAEKILHNLPFNNKDKAIDLEYKKLQKAQIIQSYVYPAISYLIPEEANKGFSAERYKFDDRRIY